MTAAWEGAAPLLRPAPLEGAALLERAVAHTRACLALVARTGLHASTPCAGWDLLALLRHMDDSLAALTDAAEVGYVDLVPAPGSGPAAVLVERLRGRACALLGAWSAVTTAVGPAGIAVGDRVLPADLLAAAGALEIAVHGWDVARACGADRPLPAALAAELLDVVPLLVGPADRPVGFAAPVVVRRGAGPSDRLLAALGRRP